MRCDILLKLNERLGGEMVGASLFVPNATSPTIIFGDSNNQHVFAGQSSLKYYVSLSLLDASALVFRREDGTWKSGYVTGYLGCPEIDLELSLYDLYGMP